MHIPGKGHGNGVAIALAALAVVIAGSGTALAVTSTVVHIEDGYTAGRFAHVDSAGHLSTSGSTSTINTNFYIVIGNNVLLGPTTATLAVTRVAASNTSRNSAYANTDFAVQLVQLTPGASGRCSDGSITRTFSNDRIPVGSQTADDYAAPLIVKPVGGAAYCLGIYMYAEAATPPASYFVPYGQVSAYVVTGSYTGPGTSATPATARGAAPLATPAHPHPAGTR